MGPSVPFSLCDYRLVAPIGEGNAGSVYSARSASEAGDARPSLAAKIIRRSKVSDVTRREVAIHFELCHRNIAKLRRVALATDTLTAQPALALILDYAPAGDMFTEVAAAGSFSPPVLRKRLLDIATGLRYLHQRHIVHLDVKLENIVICNSSTAQLIDFGCARHMPPHSHSQSHSNSHINSSSSPSNFASCNGLGGTLHYLSPEAVANDNDVDASYAMDAWALGVVAYTALVGNYPFSATVSDKARKGEQGGEEEEEEEERQVKKRILQSRPHAVPASMAIPADLQRIVTGLLEKDPAKRMTIEQVITILQQTAATTTTSLRMSRYAHLLAGSRRQRQPHRYQYQPQPQACVKSSVTSTTCAQERERSPSPSGPADADFALCPKACRACDTCRKQTLQSALEVVDTVLRSVGRREPRAQKAVKESLSRVGSIVSNCSSSSVGSSSDTAPQHVAVPRHPVVNVVEKAF